MMFSFKILYVSIYSLCVGTFLNYTEFGKNDIPSITTAKEIIDSIVLNNKSTSPLNFVYNNKFNDKIRIFLLPNSSQKIYTESDIFLVQTNKYQTSYVLHPKENISITLDSLDNAVLAIPNDSIRNNELNFIRELNERSQLPFYKITQLRSSLISKDYKEVDRLYKQEYNDNLTFLETYKKYHIISNNYENKIRAYFASHLYATQLVFIGMKSKDKVSTCYYNYLDSLEEIIIKKPQYKDDFWFNQLQYVFLKYKYRLKKNEEYADSIYFSTKSNLKGISKDRILFFILKDELNKKSNRNKILFKDFKDTNTDDDYNNYISGMYDDSDITHVSSSSTSTQTLDNLNNFDSLTSKFKGNAIYIDIWASWCAPCRREMPYSAALREKYKNKEVVFIYISTDLDKLAWKKACIEEKLEGNNSFVLSNNFNSMFANKYKIKTIPRYMLIGKDGKMITSDAPRPSDKILEELIDKNL
ncbi:MULTISPECIES: TlpA family protein disulfide reductase [Chitinophagaceae]